MPRDRPHPAQRREDDPVSAERRRTSRAYGQAVEALLVTGLGITIADVGVEWLETKYDLERIDPGPFGTSDADR